MCNLVQMNKLMNEFMYEANEQPLVDNTVNQIDLEKLI